MRRRRIHAEGRWIAKYLFAWDFSLGVSVGVIVFGTAYGSEELRSSRHVLDVTVGLGVAILAVVIAAISILTVFLTEDYGILLRNAYADVGEVFFPYRLIALTSCATAIVGTAGIFFWPTIDGGVRALVLGSATGLAVWSLIGAFDLVRITAGHARLKMRLHEVPDAYRREKHRRAS